MCICINLLPLKWWHSILWLYYNLTQSCAGGIFRLLLIFHNIYNQIVMYVCLSLTYTNIFLGYIPRCGTTKMSWACIRDVKPPSTKLKWFYEAPHSVWRLNTFSHRFKIISILTLLIVFYLEEDYILKENPKMKSQLQILNNSDTFSWLLIGRVIVLWNSYILTDLICFFTKFGLGSSK